MCMHVYTKAMYVYVKILCVYIFYYSYSYVHYQHTYLQLHGYTSIGTQLRHAVHCRYKQPEGMTEAEPEAACRVKVIIVSFFQGGTTLGCLSTEVPQHQHCMSQLFQTMAMDSSTSIRYLSASDFTNNVPKLPSNIKTFPSVIHYLYP